MKKKVTIYLIIIVIAVASLTAFVVIKKGCFSRYSKELNKIINKKTDSGELISISYSCSGDMLGNISSSTLTMETKLLLVKERVVHSDPLTTATYKVSDKDVKEIKDTV